MRKSLIGLVLGCIFAFAGEKANAQVSYVYWQYYPSIGTTKQDFLNWLNHERSIRGLSAVGYDANLDQHSHYNNVLQNSYGMGHHYFGPIRRQNASAVPDFGRVGPCWMTSPGHYAALMDPTIRWISICQYGVYTTFSAY